MQLILVPTALEARALFGRAPDALEIVALDADRRFALCGFGLAASGALAARHIAVSGCDEILLCGIAGSHDLDRAPLLSLHWGSRVRSSGIGAGQGAGHIGPEDLGFPETPEGFFELELRPGAELPSSPILSVAAASGDVDEAALLRARHPGFVLEDMESWAVALAARAFGRPLAVLRAISNEAGVRDKTRWRAGEALGLLRERLETRC